MANELKNKFFYQSVISVSQVLLPLVSYPYITRVLGPANLGKINYVDFLAQMFMIFAAFGIPFYGTREIARVRNDNNQRPALITEMSILLGFFSGAALVFFAFVMYLDKTGEPLLYLLCMINILFSAFSFDWYIHGMEAFKFAAVRSLIIRAGMLLAFFIFIKTSDDYAIYLGIFSAGFLMITITNISKILSENKFAKQPLNLKRHLRPLWHFFLTSSAISIYVYFDAILLRHITHNEAAVGQYTLVLKMVKICQVVVLSVGVVLMPRLSYLVSTNNINEIKRYLSKLFQIIITLGIPLCTGLLLLAPEIIYVIAGEKFSPAVPVLRILSFLPFIIGLSNLFSFQILIPFQKEHKFLAAVLLGCIISISLNLLLIPVLSLQGAACANLVTEITITVITGTDAFKIVRFATSKKIVLETIFCTLFFVPTIIFSRQLFSSSVIVLLFSISACALLYFFMQHFIFKNNFIKEMQGYAAHIFTTKN